MGSPSLAGIGQACDRCRQYVNSSGTSLWSGLTTGRKKVKCDGALPSCRACTVANVPCVVSARLRRRTKIRGFHKSAGEEIARLVAENEELKRQLKAERDTSTNLQNQFPMLDLATASQNRSLHGDIQISRPLSTIDTSGNALVIKHMGRLVPDVDGIERFAGSTTGVHFILSVQETLKQKGLLTAWFPENCFRMHVVSPTKTKIMGSNLSHDVVVGAQKAILYFKQLPPGLIESRIQHFVSSWSFLCPAVAATELAHRASTIINNIGHDLLERNDLSVVFQLIMIILITDLNGDGEQLGLLNIHEKQQKLAELASTLLPSILAHGSLQSVQCLVLLAVFHHLTGQYSSNIHLKGVLLQFAQSLGLHRHHRRFKFSAGEIELRKRLWWCVYILDKLTAVIHGLPQTIRDADVDVDFPMDVELEDSSATNLTLPLPGEITPARDFITLCHLGQILTSVLAQLYTTTDRRGGPDKIKALDERLRAWQARLDGNENPENLAISSTESVSKPRRPSVFWLSLMKNITRLLIHRPGLTFDASTQQFRECLNACAETSLEIIEFLTPGRQDYGAFPPLHNLVFQCALMHIHYHCFSSQGAPEEEISSRFTKTVSANVVDRAINFLRGVAAVASQTATGFNQTITDAIKLLQALSQGIFGSSPRFVASRQDLDNPAVPIFATEQHSTNSYGGQNILHMTGGPILETMNQFDSLSWIFDDQIEPFLGDFD